MDKEQAAKAAALALASILGTAACGAPSTGAEPPSAHHQVVDYAGLNGIGPNDTLRYMRGTVSVPSSVTVRQGTEAGLPPTGDPIIFHNDRTKVHNPIVIPNGGMADGPDGSKTWICGRFKNDMLGLGSDILPVHIYGCLFTGKATEMPIPTEVRDCVVQQVAPRYILCKNGDMVGRVSDEEDLKPAPTPLQKSQPTLIPPPRSKAGRFGRGS